MKGRGWALVLVLLLAARGTEILPRGREMEELKLVTALAMDGTGVTAITGVRATEGEEPEVLTGRGGSLAEACGNLRENSARRTYLGQTEQLLIGEGQDLREALDFVLANRELRLDTLLYIVKGDAGPALAASAGKTAGETGGEDPRGRTVGEVLPRLYGGEDTLIPALAPGEDGVLAPAGWAVAGPYGVKGYLEGDAALGAELLNGEGEDQVITLPGGAAEISSVRTWAREGQVCCAVTARVVQGAPAEAELAAWGEKNIRAALAPGWDCWGLDREMSALQPWQWSRWRGTKVETLEVTVTGRLVGSGGS